MNSKKPIIQQPSFIQNFGNFSFNQKTSTIDYIKKPKGKVTWQNLYSVSQDFLDEIINLDYKSIISVISSYPESYPESDKPGYIKFFLDDPWRLSDRLHSIMINKKGEIIYQWEKSV